MTEPTPPPGRDDAAETPGFDASIELVHASIDGELSADEAVAVEADESWRLRVEAARRAVDVVHAAIELPPIDQERREAHLSVALAAFDAVHGNADAWPDSTGDDRTPAPAPPTGGGDELADRRRTKAWLRRAPLGIAAAVLAAVVVVGATQLGDDDSDDVAVLDDSGGDALLEAGEAGEDMATEGAGGEAPTPTPAAADEADTDDGAQSESQDTSSRSELQALTLASEPESLEEFVDAVAAIGRGEFADRQFSPDSADALDGSCDRTQIARLAATEDKIDDVTVVIAQLDGRSVVGVVDRTDPTQVTVIDLDRCDVIAVASP